MFTLVDDFLNKITMYRLVLYVLIGLCAVAVGLTFFGLLPFSPLNLLFSIGFLLLVGWITNSVFAAVFQTTTNIESVYISALILALIITPARSTHELVFLFWAAVWTMAGKFIFAYRAKHLFNPVALGVLLPSVFIAGSASWWVGNAVMLVPVLVGGFLVTRKIRRGTMVAVFILAATLTILGASFFGGPDLISLVQKIFAESPILFFAFIMLTEPLTTPPTKDLRIYYAALVGILFAPQVHIGSLFTTPESALILGNIFSFLVGSKERLILTLRQKIPTAPDSFDYIFTANHQFNFKPGQYLEWTLGHSKADSRGNRRYFTIASSPTEDNIRVGVKHYQPSSSFKNKLFSLNIGDQITATSLAGDFTLPKDPDKKLVFIAGGIGITPFRSIFKYLCDKGEKRDIVLFYANKMEAEIVYQDVINEAKTKLGSRIIYIVSDNASPGWTGETGRITPEMIEKYVPDYKTRFFYLSGPHSMVDAYEAVLKSMKIPGGQIVTDYFPGFA